MSKGFAALAPVLSLALMLAAPSVSQAALSGFYDSAAKMQAIMSDGNVADALHQAPVTMLMRVDSADGTAEVWEVTSADCTLKVQLDATPLTEGRVGGNSYQVTVIEACT